MRDGLEEFLCSGACERIQFLDLACLRTRHIQGFPFRGKLRYEPNALRSRSVYAAPGEQQITDKSVTQIALQSRYAAKSRYQSQPQFGKCKSRHLVGDDNVAGQRQFQPAAKTNSVHCRNSYKRRCVDGVQYRVNAFQKLAHAREPFPSVETRRAFVKLPQIRSRRKSMLPRAGNSAH